jgi:hypothetical protein
VFQYTLNLGPESGTRIINHIFNSINIGRAISVYTSDAGAHVRLSAGAVEISPAQITLIPSPGGFVALCSAGGLTLQRHRRRRGTWKTTQFDIFSARIPLK